MPVLWLQIDGNSHFCGSDFKNLMWTEDPVVRAEAQRRADEEKSDHAIALRLQQEEMSAARAEEERRRREGQEIERRRRESKKDKCVFCVSAAVQHAFAHRQRGLLLICVAVVSAGAA